mgnify:CR=1 FL=1
MTSLNLNSLSSDSHTNFSSQNHESNYDRSFPLARKSKESTGSPEKSNPNKNQKASHNSNNALDSGRGESSYVQKSEIDTVEQPDSGIGYAHISGKERSGPIEILDIQSISHKQSHSNADENSRKTRLYEKGINESQDKSQNETLLVQLNKSENFNLQWKNSISYGNDSNSKHFEENQLKSVEKGQEPSLPREVLKPELVALESQILEEEEEEKLYDREERKEEGTKASSVILPTEKSQVDKVLDKLFPLFDFNDLTE